MKMTERLYYYSHILFCHSGENKDRMVDHQACLNGIPHVRSLPKESQNPATKNYTKAIVNGWIPDEEYLKARALRYSSSGMTGDELLMTNYTKDII